jgi:RNA polymerase sigma factor (sigma-70 family)
MSRQPPPFHHLLRDLPSPLQRAVHHAVAQQHPTRAPRSCACHWQEELYHEAAVAACKALQTYDPTKGSLYSWGLRVIGQHLQRFCAKEWQVARQECAYPCDEETGEEVAFVDGEALEWIEERVLCAQVRAALAQLPERERCLIEWYFGEGLSERAIAKWVGKSKSWVHKRLGALVARLRRLLLGGSSEEVGKSGDFE